MTYFQFVQAVETRVRAEAGGGVSISVLTAPKNNGTQRKGLLFTEKDSNISPTIYLEEYYRQFLKGDSIESIAGQITELYGKLRFRKPFPEEVFKDYELLEERIVYRLVNREANAEALREIPFVPWMDLAVIFYVLLEVNPGGTAAMPVRNEHLRYWGVTKEQVYERACSNTRLLLPYDFRPMQSVIAELSGAAELCGGGEEEDILYVLSNRLRSFGAAAVLYPGRLEEIGGRLREDYYILPSSVHEMIILRKSGASDRESLSALVREINETQVEPEEVLSDQVYYYDRALGKLVR